MRAKGLCNKHYRRRYHPRPTNEDVLERRRADLRRRTQLRRARVRDPEAEDFSREEIGERDGWRCGLCRKPVDKTLLWPDPRSASLDHIVPLSFGAHRGGRHRRDNVQIAHLECNLAKGNRVEDVQPLLVG